MDLHHFLGSPNEVASSMSPSSPPDSIISCQTRLKALANYQILDTDYEAAFDGIVKLAANICNAPIAVINFIDHERQWFKAEIGLGIRETPLDISICRHAVLEEDVMVINDTQTDTRTKSNPLVFANDKNLRFYAGALLKSGPNALGTLCVLDHEPRTITDTQVEALKLLRDQIMHLLDFRRLHLTQRLLVKELDESRHALQRQAHLDPLTGLLNRRAFEVRLRFELESILDPENPGALMMIDLDKFKDINDQHGHLTGDKVLKCVSQALRKAIRTSDILARWGGDEFLVLLPATQIGQAIEVAGRVLHALEKNEVGLTLPGKVSASIGLASLRGYTSADDIIAAADAAMYDAKKSAGTSRTRVKTPAP